MASFFFIFTFIMFGVKSSRDARSQIQNGFWFFKYILVIGLVVGFFFIKNESLANRNFFLKVFIKFYFFSFNVDWIIRSIFVYFDSVNINH